MIWRIEFSYEGIRDYYARTVKRMSSGHAAVGGSAPSFKSAADPARCRSRGSRAPWRARTHARSLFGTPTPKWPKYDFFF